MEVIRTFASAMGYMKMCIDLIDTSRKRGADLRFGLKYIKEDLDFIKSHLVQNKELHRDPLMQLKLQELAYDIDDFVHGLWIPGPCGAVALSATGLDPRPDHIARIELFRVQAKTLREALAKPPGLTMSGSCTATPAVSAGSSSSAAATPGVSYTPVEDLVGIAKPKEEIVDLLSRRDGHLRVISIVGCSGLGKTALARALYEDDVLAEEFDDKAWVVASDHKPTDILNKIFQELRLVPSGETISEALQPIPKNRRYLVFLDGVQRGTPWEDIQYAFRENVMDSRIIITTTVPSIARAGSSGSYVYTMEGLDKDNSRKLFRGKFWRNAGYSAEDEYGLDDNDVDIIIDKCDGLPIALISAAKCLRGKGQYPKSEDFKQVSQELRDCLACSDSAFEDFQQQNGFEAKFAEMRRARVEPYQNQLNNGEKECLLYVSIFPCGHEINSKSLIRRLVAEGLVPRDPDIVKAPESVVGDVRECVRKLMEQRMIEPVPIHSYSNVAKRCRVHSIMLQFTIKKAASRNFVSQIHNNQLLRSSTGLVRRLTVQSSAPVRSANCQEGIDLSVLRSLALFKSTVLDFKKCKLVRILDLQGCCGVTQKDLQNICRLLFLKYLSLRNTGIPELPENMKELRFLETLDTRDTTDNRDTQDKVVIKLPVEVLMLPRFTYLFGKFELTNAHSNNTKELTKFFSDKKSQLHTFGGIAVHEAKCLKIFLLVLQHATKLKKVKLWYRDTASSIGAVTTTSTTAVGGTTEPIPCATSRQGLFLLKKKPNTETFPCVSILAKTLKKRSVCLESVSVYFSGVPNTFLDFLQTNGTISSIKLQKGSGSLPGRAELEQVRNLKKVHLFSTGIDSGNLANLQHLKCLQYLKLEENGHGLWDSVFHIQVGGFRSLIWLCFEASNSLHPPLKIDEGVKTPIASLLLLCQEIGVGGPKKETEQGHLVTDISHLRKLNEVILHHSASDAVVKAWEEEAKKHINRPYVEKKPEKEEV